ncbi:MAG: A/G-specific adenine glycosylase [Verrucomicrobia bacterium]|nr:A/G-specific adenine glycosylase [Verrucomicrobiota bacterium]
MVSELMCQQTQIATVIPYFERWTARWPDFPQLARAEEAEVMAMWAGLGYYSRARNLLALARQVAALPQPPRTAAAIASIAFAEPVAVVDGNVVRVLARLDGVRAKLRDASSAAKLFTGRADELVDPKHPGDFNQAMMELGATVCRKGAPDCARCPLAAWCDAKAQGDAATLPRFVSKERKEAAVGRALVLRDDKILLRRNPPGAKRLAGMAEIPDLSSLGLAPDGDPALVRRRTIGTVTYEEKLFAVAPKPAELRKWARDAELEWVDAADLDGAALSGPHRRWLGEWLSRDGRKARGRRP